MPDIIGIVFLVALGFFLIQLLIEVFEGSEGLIGKLIFKTVKGILIIVAPLFLLSWLGFVIWSILSDWGFF